MPVLNKLTQDEVDALTTRKTNVDHLAQYIEFLKDAQPGEWGSLTPDEGETQRVVKRRLTTAAKLAGYKIRYRGNDADLKFQIVVLGATRQRGRPKLVEQEAAA